MAIYTATIVLHVAKGSNVQLPVFTGLSGIQMRLFRIITALDSAAGMNVLMKLVKGDHDILPQNGFLRVLQNPIHYDVDEIISSGNKIEAKIVNQDTINDHDIYVVLQFEIIG
jgi:hypothetical protein